MIAVVRCLAQFKCHSPFHTVRTLLKTSPRPLFFSRRVRKSSSASVRTYFPISDRAAGRCYTQKKKKKKNTTTYVNTIIRLKLNFFLKYFFPNYRSSQIYFYSIQSPILRRCDISQRCVEKQISINIFVNIFVSDSGENDSPRNCAYFLSRRTGSN